MKFKAKSSIIWDQISKNYQNNELMFELAQEY